MKPKTDFLELKVSCKNCYWEGYIKYDIEEFQPFKSCPYCKSERIETE